MPSRAITRHADEPPGWADLARTIGTFYHDPRWIREIAACFAYRVHWLAAGEGTLGGGLALAEVPALLGPARLVSFPFSFVAGPMARDHDIAQALTAAARELAGEWGLKRVEIKQLGSAGPVADGFVRSMRYTTYRVSTSGGEQAVWKRLHVTSTQQRIRKGQKAGVIVEMGRTVEDWLAMAGLEERVQQAFGVPAPPRGFFLGTCRRLQEAGLADLYLARVPDGRVAAGFVMFKGPRECWGAPPRSRRPSPSSSCAGVRRPFPSHMITGPTPVGCSRRAATVAFWRWPPGCGRGCRRRWPAWVPACTATWGDRAPILLAAPQENSEALGEELFLPLVARPAAARVRVSDRPERVYRR